MNLIHSLNQVLKDLKQDFGLTARESIALQAVHSLGCARHNYVQVEKVQKIAENK